MLNSRFKKIKKSSPLSKLEVKSKKKRKNKKAKHVTIDWEMLSI